MRLIVFARWHSNPSWPFHGQIYFGTVVYGWCNLKLYERTIIQVEYISSVVHFNGKLKAIELTPSFSVRRRHFESFHKEVKSDCNCQLSFQLNAWYSILANWCFIFIICIEKISQRLYGYNWSQSERFCLPKSSQTSLFPSVFKTLTTYLHQLLYFLMLVHRATMVSCYILLGFR